MIYFKYKYLIKCNYHIIYNYILYIIYTTYIVYVCGSIHIKYSIMLIDFFYSQYTHIYSIKRVKYPWLWYSSEIRQVDMTFSFETIYYSLECNSIRKVHFKQKLLWKPPNVFPSFISYEIAPHLSLNDSNWLKNKSHFLRAFQWYHILRIHIVNSQEH